MLSQQGNAHVLWTLDHVQILSRCTTMYKEFPELYMPVWTGPRLLISCPVLLHCPLVLSIFNHASLYRLCMPDPKGCGNVLWTNSDLCRCIFINAHWLCHGEQNCAYIYLPICWLVSFPDPFRKGSGNETICWLATVAIQAFLLFCFVYCKGLYTALSDTLRNRTVSKLHISNCWRRIN